MIDADGGWRIDVARWKQKREIEGLKGIALQRKVQKY